MARRAWGTIAPPPSATHDVSNPLARKLAAFWVFRNGGGKILSNYPGTPDWAATWNGTLTWVPTRAGTGIKGDGSTGYVEVSDIRAFYNQSPTTIWVLIDTKMTGGTQGLIGTRVGFNNRIMQLNGNSFEIENNIGGFQNLSFSSSETGLHAIALTYDGVNSTSWFDGVQKVTAGGGSGLYTTSGGAIPFHISRDNGGNYASESIIAVGLWQRVLTSAEMQLLARRPFALFETPIWRRYGAGVAGGATYPQTVSASQAQAAALLTQANLIRAGAQSQAAAIAKTVVLVRADTQTQSVALSKTANLTRSTTQAQSVSITSLKVLLRTVTATQAQAVALLKQAVLIRVAAQSQSVVLQKQASLVRAMTQAQSVARQVQTNLSRSTTESQSVSITSLKVLIRIVTATQAQVATLAKQISVIRSAAQQQSLTVSKSLALSRTLQQAQAVGVRSLVSLTRSLMESQIASVVTQYVPAAGSVLPAATLLVVGRTRAMVALARTRILQVIDR